MAQLIPTCRMSFEKLGMRPGGIVGAGAKCDRKRREGERREWGGKKGEEGREGGDWEEVHMERGKKEKGGWRYREGERERGGGGIKGEG